jgi:hypothetical protein
MKLDMCNANHYIWLVYLVLKTLLDFFQIDKNQFEHTVTQINNLYLEAESLNSRTYCESCVACLTAYLTYICMDTYYEKVKS